MHMLLEAKCERVCGVFVQLALFGRIKAMMYVLLAKLKLTPRVHLDL